MQRLEQPLHAQVDQRVPGERHLQKHRQRVRASADAPRELVGDALDLPLDGERGGRGLSGTEHLQTVQQLASLVDLLNSARVLESLSHRIQCQFNANSMTIIQSQDKTYAAEIELRRLRARGVLVRCIRHPSRLLAK